MKQFIRNVGESVTQNSPTILTSFAIVGVFSTTVLACKATPRAMELLEEERFKRKHSFRSTEETVKISTKEAIQICWKVYIPAATVGVLTMGCIIGINSIHSRRSAALAGLYSITEAALKEYQDKVVETIGTNKERKIRDDVDSERLKSNPVGTNEIIVTGNGDVLCYDALSGRYFNSDIEQIKQTINNLNRELLTANFISLNEVYYELGLSDIDLGKDIGWSSEYGLIDPRFSSQLSEENKPCLVLTFTVHPRFV